MKFTPLSVQGAMLVEIEPITDARGLFARTFCEREFAACGLPDRFAQHSISFNRRRGTLRGLHFQREPHGEAKLVRCLRGAAFDVVVDLRAGTPGFGRWCSVEITDIARNAVFVPRGCAHGFQSLLDDTELLYLIDVPYVPDSASGIRWDDPQVGITWPIAEPTVSARDELLPRLGS